MKRMKSTRKGVKVDKIFGALEMSSRDSEINQKTSFASISGIVGHDSNASYKQTVVVISHEPHHLPTKFVAYAWQDARITFNNSTGKPLVRLRDFCYSVTTRHGCAEESRLSH